MSQPALRGRYQLGRELGRGFSSIVYEATDTRRGRIVALKVLTLLQNLSPTRRREMAERFEREARAISALSHPAIVAVYDAGQTDEGQEYLVMERLQGETLRARLERTGPLLRAEALPLMVQIADALQYAHGRGIIHRDVKPDNIFLCTDGTAKLMDFGIAHVFADESLTQTGTLVGSPAYMSPEQINGETLDGRSDVFSLAVTLVETLTGRKPFEGPNISSVLNRILNQPPQMAGISAPALHKALERALAKTASLRTASAGAFAGALRRVQPFPSTAQTITGTHVMQRPMLSQPRRSIAWPMAALGLIMLTIWTCGAVFVGMQHHPAAHTLPAVPRIISLPQPAAHFAPMVSLSLPPVPQQPRVVPLQNSVPASLPDAAATPIADTDTTKITEHIPAPQTSPPLTLSTLNALRSEAPPQTDTQAMPPPSDTTSGPAPDVPPHLVQSALPHVPPGIPSPFLPASVGLLVSVNLQGDVSHARVTQSSGNAQLDAAAIASALTWQYSPATRAGRPVPADVMGQVNFSE